MARGRCGILKGEQGGNYYSVTSMRVTHFKRAVDTHSKCSIPELIECPKLLKTEIFHSTKRTFSIASKLGWHVGIFLLLFNSKMWEFTVSGHPTIGAPRGKSKSVRFSFPDNPTLKRTINSSAILVCRALQHVFLWAVDTTSSRGVPGCRYYYCRTLTHFNQMVLLTFLPHINT